MGKKDKAKSKMELHIWDERQTELSIAEKELYPGGELMDILFSSDGNALNTVMEKALAATSTPKSLTDDEMAEHCLQVRDNVKQGKADNIEIQFDKGMQMFLRKKHELGDTIIKVRTFDGETSPTCIYIRAGGMLKARLFIGGDKVMAIMATQNEQGEEKYFRLSEFHLFSIQKNSDTGKDAGLITSYMWLTARVYSSIFLGHSFEPIRSLLLADWLHSEWQRAKEASEQSSGEKIGEDVDEE